MSRRRRPVTRNAKLMKSFTVIASSLLLCSCADMTVTKTYVPNSGVASSEVDAKDYGSIRYETNCGVGAANPAAIYIRPFCIDSATFRGEEASEGGMAIQKALTPVAFANDLKEELEKIAPALVISDNETPKLGWLVEGRFDLVDGGDRAGRFFFGVFGAGQSTLALHVKITDVEKHRVIYEFDMAGGSHAQGKFGTLRASGLGRATPFDLHNAAERIYLALSPDPFRYGTRTSMIRY